MSIDFVVIYPPTSFDYAISTKTLPLGGLYLADSLMNKGYSVAILDDTVENIKKNLKNMVSDKTIALGISSLSGAQLSNAISIAKFLKANYPQKPIIWGGAHVTALPKQTLESELVDFVVWGEGENSLPQLLKGIQTNSDLSKIRGIGNKIKGEAIITERSNYTEIEDKVFKLPYHLLKMDNYARKLSIGLNRCFFIYSSRGCPFKCKFCSNSSSIWPNTKMRYHSIDNIVNDIRTLITQYGADGITFGDENFFVSEERLIDKGTTSPNAWHWGIRVRAKQF